MLSRTIILINIVWHRRSTKSGKYYQLRQLLSRYAFVKAWNLPAFQLINFLLWDVLRIFIKRVRVSKAINRYKLPLEEMGAYEYANVAGLRLLA